MGPRPTPGRSSTSKSGTRWSLPITFLLLFTAAQQGEPLIATPNLELAMMDYETLGEYSQEVVEEEDSCSCRRSITTSTTTGPPSTTAGPPSTTTAGRIIIVGGLKAVWTPSTSNSEALFGPALPPFPVAVHGNTLSRAGGRVYSCGGKKSSYETFKKCWVIDTWTEGAAWRSFYIPWELRQHSAVVVQDEIWFFSDSKLRIVDTRNPANGPREISLGFSFDEHNCAVAHGSKTFVIGVGERRNEVHVNSDHSKPQQWGRFSTLLQGRRYFVCHEFGGEVFVTGGRAWRTNVEAISVVDGTVRSIGLLGGERRYHQMAIIEGRLAVLGGWNGTAMATIETYDEQTNSWETLGRTLAEPRYNFGLTQFLP